MTDLTDDLLRALLYLARDEDTTLRTITLGQLADALDASRSATRVMPEEQAGPVADFVHVVEAGGKAGSAPAPPLVNTRTRAGREAFAKAILKALGEFGVPVSGKQVKTRTGGTTNQIWRAMNRLIEAGEVAYEGRAGGVKYSLA